MRSGRTIRNAYAIVSYVLYLIKILNLINYLMLLKTRRMLSLLAHDVLNSPQQSSHLSY